jgi:predicted MFS family arabinose efflux permease
MRPPASPIHTPPSSVYSFPSVPAIEANLDQSRHSSTGEMTFRHIMAISILARLFVDTGVQIFHPFLALIATGLHTDLTTMGRLLSLRSATGLLAPLFGALADRHGYRRMLQIGLLLSGMGLFTIGASNTVSFAAAGMVLAGLGLAGFVPTLQAYLSARLPYARRAQGLGILEYSWAITGIVGLFLMGQLIAATSWRIPFFVLAAGLLGMLVIFTWLPPARPGQPGPIQQSSTPFLRRAFSFLRFSSNIRSTYATMAAGALNYFAGILLMTIYGAWLTQEYALAPGELGTVALVFGLFDLTASVSVSLFTDRIGKRRSVIAGMVATLLGYLLIPLLNMGLLPVVLIMASTRGAFEFALVSNFPLLSEQVPDERAKVMSLSAAFSLGAATLASYVAPLALTHYGIQGVTSLSAGAAAVALLLFITQVREAAP